MNCQIQSCLYKWLSLAIVSQAGSSYAGKEITGNKEKLNHIKTIPHLWEKQQVRDLIFKQSFPVVRRCLLSDSKSLKYSNEIQPKFSSVTQIIHIIDNRRVKMCFHRVYRWTEQKRDATVRHVSNAKIILNQRYVLRQQCEIRKKCKAF